MRPSMCVLALGIIAGAASAEPMSPSTYDLMARLGPNLNTDDLGLPLGPIYPSDGDERARGIVLTPSNARLLETGSHVHETVLPTPGAAVIMGSGVALVAGRRRR